MFYLLVSDTMVTATAKITDPTTGLEVDQPQEFRKLSVWQEADDIESLVGWLNLSLESRENEIWKQIFITITDHDGMQQELYMIYDWLPSSLILRLEPPIDELKDIVPTRGVHYNPFQHSCITKHLKAQAKAEKIAAKTSKVVVEAAE